MAKPPLVLLLALCMVPLQVRADEVEDFYRGRTLTVMVGVGAGGEFDL